MGSQPWVGRSTAQMSGNPTTGPSLLAYLCDTYRFRGHFGFEIEKFRYFRYRFGIGIERSTSGVSILILVLKGSPLGIDIGIGFEA